MYIYIFTYIYTYIHIYIYMHIDMHIYIYIYIDMSGAGPVAQNALPAQVSFGEFRCRGPGVPRETGCAFEGGVSGSRVGGCFEGLDVRVQRGPCRLWVCFEVLGVGVQGDSASPGSVFEGLVVEVQGGPRQHGA